LQGSSKKGCVRMDRLRNAVPSTLTDLFRKESHRCFAVRIFGVGFLSRAHALPAFLPTLS
jgi:hypothetical protein